jgi:hypothetical protein
MMEDWIQRKYGIEFAEAQLVFVNLAAKWEITGQGDDALRRELEAAEKRLVQLFCNGWGSRTLMSKGWSAYREHLLYQTKQST